MQIKNVSLARRSNNILNNSNKMPVQKIFFQNKTNILTTIMENQAHIMKNHISFEAKKNKNDETTGTNKAFETEYIVRRKIGRKYIKRKALEKKTEALDKLNEVKEYKITAVDDIKNILKRAKDIQNNPNSSNYAHSAHYEYGIYMDFYFVPNKQHPDRYDCFKYSKSKKGNLHLTEYYENYTDSPTTKNTTSKPQKTLTFNKYPMCFVYREEPENLERTLTREIMISVEPNNTDKYIEDPLQLFIEDTQVYKYTENQTINNGTKQDRKRDISIEYDGETYLPKKYRENKICVNAISQKKSNIEIKFSENGKPKKFIYHPEQESINDPVYHDGIYDYTPKDN